MLISSPAPLLLELTPKPLLILLPINNILAPAARQDGSENDKANTDESFAETRRGKKGLERS